ncbi:hypothetical protein DFH11DRAFT_1746560 [Phellopilus nigrolimitatus]|nr:hypothetical protein DFH11DRAFT_1746560 [Phellopilus nigrolimitatus]
MRAALALAAAPLAAFPAVCAGTTELWWSIAYVEGVNPEGLFPRRAIGANGSWPPPIDKIFRSPPSDGDRLIPQRGHSPLSNSANTSRARNGDSDANAELFLDGWEELRRGSCGAKRRSAHRQTDAA